MSLKGACASRNTVSKQKETPRQIYIMAVGSSFYQATSTPVQHAEKVLVSGSFSKQHTLLANTKLIQVKVALCGCVTIKSLVYCFKEFRGIESGYYVVGFYHYHKILG